jgi:hypothetical protein
MAGRATIIREASCDRPATFACEADERRGTNGSDCRTNDSPDELTAAQTHTFRLDITG